MLTPSALVRKEIERFLRSAYPEVLCVSGAWGVGKTYLWRQVLIETSKSQPILPMLSYAYVSLFGVDTLEDLRLSIFANRISLRPTRLWRWGQFLFSRAKKAQSLLEQVPKVGPLFITLGAMYFSSVRRMIVCIDDLERRSNNLDIKDVLGLISYLKEERQCKVVLLLNDEELGEETDTFRSHFEKTIDAHVKFAPTAEESAIVAFPYPDEVANQIKVNCMKLGIKNVRIIRKIERAVRTAQPHLQDFDWEIQASAARSIVLLEWAHLLGTDAPSIDHIRKRSGLTTYSFDKQSKPTPQEALWNSLLDDYNWGALDDLDIELISSLESGYFNPDKLRIAAGEVWKKLELQRLDGNFEDAWKGYHDSFDDDQDAVLDRLADSFKKTYKTITFSNLDGTISLFKALGRAAQAKELLTFYVHHRTEPQTFWDLGLNAFAGEIKDPEVRDAINAKFQSFGSSEVNMAKLLGGMGSAGTVGFDIADVDAIAALPVIEYTKLFKTKRGRELRRIINGGLTGVRSVNSPAGFTQVASKTVEALRQIAAESPLNARRVKLLYNVSIEPEDSGASPQ
jgi:hypothetical protein